MQLEIINLVETKKQTVDFNGDASISRELLLDRASLFGDGFYTTGVIENGKLVYRKQHLDRLVQSAQKLRFEPLDLKALLGKLDLMSESVGNAIVRINISRKQSQRGYSISAKAINYAQIILSPISFLSSDNCDLVNANYEISKNRQLGGIKHLNRLDSVLASSELTTANQEGIMYHEEQVICGSKSNLFVKINGLWITPEIKECGVLGIMRQQVIDKLIEQNVNYQIRELNRSELENVSSAFVTNCVIGVWPAKSINGRPLDVQESEELKEILV